MRQIALATADEAVYHAHAILLREQAVHHVAADKAGASGNDGNGRSAHFAPIFFMVRTL